MAYNLTTYTNDPVRVKITLDQIWSLSHAKGIDSTFYPSEQKDEYFCKLVASSINPHSPSEEKYKEDLEKEFEKLNIVQDHIREHQPYRHFNCKNSRVIETILDEKVFSKENRYDILLDKVNEVHRLRDGRLFGTIENS
jgi:hypothetical protein